MDDDGSGGSSFPKPEHLGREVRDSLRRYWRSNVRLMVVLLSIWAVSGLGCGVLFADHLSDVRLGGYPLGFWFAQQGSIVIFVVLILVYAVALNRLDARHHDELERIAGRDWREAAREAASAEAEEPPHGPVMGGTDS